MNVRSRFPVAKHWRLFLGLTLSAGLVLRYWPLAGEMQASTKDRGRASAKMDSLTIELRLSKDHYRVSESVNAEVIFRNEGKKKVLVPLEKDAPLLFFDFVIIGDGGTQLLTRYADGWGDPAKRHIQFIPLDPGKTHKVSLRDIVSLKAFDAGVHPKEQYKVLAIYRGFFAYKQNPAAWRGTIVSPLASIKRITMDESDE